MVAPKSEHIFDIPDTYRSIFEAQNVLTAFELRPLNQQAGYVKWLNAARGSASYQKRIIVVVEELRAGVYMLDHKSENG